MIGGGEGGWRGAVNRCHGVVGLGLQMRNDAWRRWLGRPGETKLRLGSGDVQQTQHQRQRCTVVLLIARLFQSGANTRLLNRSTTRFSMSSLPEGGYKEDDK